MNNLVFEVHLNEWDLWIGASGEITFLAGGELVNPKPKSRADGTVDERELRSEEAVKVSTYVLHTGDVLWIPPGVPHRHRTTGTGRAWIVKLRDK